MFHSRRVVFLAGMVCLCSSSAVLNGQSRFVRGDVEDNGTVNIADPVRTLGFLFLGTPAQLACPDAADANDDGVINLTDAIFALGFLFLGSRSPGAPFPDCGLDPTDDNLGCEVHAACPGPPQPPQLTPPPSPTREPSIDLRGTAAPGLTVRVTGGVSPTPYLVTAGVDGAFTVAVELSPRRLNRIYAVAVDAQDQSSAPAAVEVIQDPEPPFVYIDEPTAGSTVLVDKVTVTGRVSDMLSGYLGLSVTVNGEPAQIAIGIGTNGTFERQDVPLALGANIVRVVATDVVGNSAEREITVTREEVPAGADRLVLVSGNGKKAPIHTTLGDPIVVRATTADGSPLEGKLLTFEVVRSDGRLSAVPLPAPEDLAMTLVARTDADGLAQAHWTLGTDAGCGNNRVKVRGDGLAGEVLFCASATPGPAAQINIGSGQNQRGEAGAPLAEALKAWVSDGCNGIPGVPVTFRVTQGTGTVNGLALVTIPTGPTGHAQVSFVLGPEGGNQRVEAQFDSNPTGPAVFTAYALVRDETRPTTFSGLVLDNASQPIGGARVTLEMRGLPSVETTTHLTQGSFQLEAPGSGAASLRVEGYYATRLGGEAGTDILVGSFPSLTYEVVIVPNAENALSAPVLLPPLDPDNAVVFDGTQDVVLRVKGVEGLEMRVPAGTRVRLLDRTEASPANPVRLSLNQVHHDDVPMPMPDGAAPPFAWTLQPAGTTFDPPLEVTYPNMSGLPAGAIAYFLTFNHDTQKFEIFASGHVVGDGAVIRTDPGAGIGVAGWGCNCPPYSVTGTCQSKCNKCPEDLTIKPISEYDKATQELENNPVRWDVTEPAGVASNLRELECRYKKLIEKLSAAGATGIRLESVFRTQGYQDHLKNVKKARAALDDLSAECKAACAQLVAAVNAEDKHNSIGTIAENAPSRHTNGTAFDLSKKALQGVSTEEIADLALQVGLRLRIDAGEAAHHFELLGGGPKCLIESPSPFPPVLAGLPLEPGSEYEGDGLIEEGDEPYADEVSHWELKIATAHVTVPRFEDFLASNISAPDLFGPGGPGTARDFLSDDFTRVTGTATIGGQTYYAFSDPFQIRQGETYIVPELTVTPNPPPLPSAIRIESPSTEVAPGASVQLTVLGTLGDGSEADLTSRDAWTTYRTSNPRVAMVGKDGLVEAKARGTAYITAVNEGATAVKRITVVQEAPGHWVNSIGMDLVYIAPGTFQMGSPDTERGRFDWEGPVHTVHLTQGFYMGVTEVTQGEYLEVMGENPSAYQGQPDNLSRPVETVSWHDAMEFARRLSDLEGRTYTLPTEAQWEYAARAGTTTRFSFGDALECDDFCVACPLADEHVWWCGNNTPFSTKPVAQKQPNPWGIFDMHGNVLEWCRDAFDDIHSYTAGETTDPESGPGAFRVLRGGVFRDLLLFCRSARRGQFDPDDSYNYLGLRVVLVSGLPVE